MATKEQIEQVMARFMYSRPVNMGQTGFNNSGMIGVLILLHHSSDIVTAGRISEVLHISTARVAALIKKMVEKDLIVKETGVTDARVVEIRMTDHGREVIEDIQQERRERLGEIIDQVGMERLMEYFDTSAQIHSIMSKPLSVEL